jgi:hypothetical protein
MGDIPVARVFSQDKVLPFMQMYMVFGLFWTWSFILGVWQTTIAGAIATWYWTRDKKSLPKSPVLHAFSHCFSYHLGSIAFGSLIIAIIQFIRYIIYEAQRKLKHTDNQAAKHILACLQCCFMCVEKFMSFINKNAYIEIAVYGYSFCQAAKAAFQLLLRNAFRFVVLDKVTDFLLLLGKLLIVFITCILGLYFLQKENGNQGYYYAVPLIVSTIPLSFVSKDLI